jgi:prophage regulatory protein
MLILSYADVRARGIPLSQNRLWRLERAGRFPKRVNISANRVGWVASEIDEYLRQRIAEALAARDNPPAQVKRPRSPGRPRKAVEAQAAA